MSRSKHLSLSRLQLMMQHHNSPFRIRRLNSCVQTFMGSSPIVTRNSSSSNDTYYDSQSGQHVAIHDESKITVYLRGDYRTTPPSSIFLTAAKELGMAGSIITLPQQTTTRQQEDIGDGNNSSAAKFIESLSSDSADGSNKIFLHLQPTQYYDLVAAKHTATISKIKPNINLCFEYNNDDDYISSNIQSAMNKFDNDGITQTQTSIGIFNTKYLLDEDPISVASQIASIIDTTSEQCGIGSISNILVAPIAGDEEEAYQFTRYDDELVQLCEELSYLDVPGSTIKSRLVVSALSSDQLEECLQMGITKYVIDYHNNNSYDGCDIDSVESRLNMLQDAVEENGKELVLNVRQ